ncbi:MAG: EAL domain-containing protein [Geminicoccaceae bacterium]|nr:EAL domain-containing protein [Geminicoccaceae bacterium]
MPRILVVDDDEEDIVLLRELLTTGLGPETHVLAAAAVEQAFTLLACEPIDLCLVDWRIGSSSGLEFLERARTIRRVPMVLLTGAGDSTVDHAAQDAGAAYYLDKAELTAERLDRVVRYCLGHPPAGSSHALGPRPERDLSATGECPRILLIDDDEDDYLLTRELLGEIFGGRLRLDWARNWDAALAAISEQRHEVYLVDYRLGERTGLELVREAVERGCSAPFIVLTGQGSREIDLEAMRAGAMDYLVKGEITAPLLDRSIRYSIERHRAERRLAEIAQLDQLTGLPNRYLLQDFLTRSLARATRFGHSVALLLVDLDRFKPVNDIYGHHAGDRLLQAIATRLRSTVRASDLVARLGGDEFTVVLTDLEDPDAAVAQAERVLDAIRLPVELDGCEVEVGASIGIAVYPRDAADIEELLSSADAAMYTAKAGKVGGIHLYTGEMRQRQARRQALERSLRQAVAGNEFCLFYQPQIEVRSGRLVGFEALIRWRHPELGLISPAEFIHLTEETGLIGPIGEWVLKTACAQLAGWRRRGHRELSLAVNLSPRQMHETGLASLLARLLAEHGLPPGLLELEITESHLLQKPEEVRRMLAAFSQIGVRVSLDDFGTGFSSLNHLRAFPGASLKIDRSFIQGIEENGSDAAIVRSLIAMAHSLNLKVIAEGVERPAQLRMLTEYGCDYVQGFLLGEPAPAEEIGRRFLDRQPVSQLGRGSGRAGAWHDLDRARRLLAPGS